MDSHTLEAGPGAGNNVPSTGPSPLRGSGTAHMVLGMLVAAFAAYVFQVAGGRVLGTEDFAPISVLWTMQFLIVTVLFTPLEQLVIRRLAMSGGAGSAIRPVLPALVGVVGGGTLASVLFVVVTVDSNFMGEWQFALTAAVLFVGYGVFSIGRGFLGGRRRFRAYGYALGGEAVVRLAAAGLVLAAAPGPLALAWSMTTGAWIVLAARPFRAVRVTADRRSEDLGSTGNFLTGLFAGNAASQTILASGPLVVGALGAGAADVSIFFATFTLFRGPLTMSYAFLARILPPLTALAARGEDALLWLWARRLTLAGLAASALAGLGGYLIGPQIVVLLFGGEFEPTPGLAGLAAAGVVAGGMAFFIGQVLVAQGRTGRFAAVWLAALVVAAVAVAVGGEAPMPRTGVGFVAGEGFALIATAAATRRAGGKPGSPAPGPAAASPSLRSSWSPSAD